MSGTRIINGVRTVYVDGAPRFATADVASILGWNVRSLISCLPDEMLVNADVSKWHARNGDTNHITTIDEDGLRKVVAFATNEIFPVSIRHIWIDNWAKDLIVRSQVASYEADDPMCDFQTALQDMPDPVPDIVPLDPEDAEARVVTADGERTRALRRQVRRALEPMSRALQSLEDAVTYADGLRTGVSLASPDGACVGSLVNLFIDLRGAEDELERVNSELEDIANGGDDD